MLEYKFDVAKAIAHAIQVPLVEFAPTTYALTYEGELWVFVDSLEISSPKALQAAKRIVDVPPPDSVSAVHYVLTEWIPDDQEKVPMGLGRSAVSVRMALRKLLDLPSTFEASQGALIGEALSAVRQLSVAPVRMVLVDQHQNRFLDAAHKLKEFIQEPRIMGGGLAFVEAEAGKGKTILLASAAQSMRDDKRGKLPVFIPLRKLPLASGVAWESITQLIGIVGEGSERLIRAIKSGLVTIFLDGIDEVSGRYDKNLIRDLLQLMTDRLGSPQAVVILSGRRTEARHLDSSKWEIFSVELPDIESADFKSYVESVLDGLILQSENLVGIELPREYDEIIGNRPADEHVDRQRDYIVSWILEVFPEVAKEPSLFFVQGLAAIAIGRRAGNRAVLHNDSKPFVPRIWDVCLSATVFACIRETSKIDSVAALEYSVKNQMRALQGLAAISSAPPMTNIPTPNELVPGAFDVDPVNSPEIYVAITRQNAKHALLYATEAAGGYRPQFLSDWIRCSLIAQIFNSEPSLGSLSRDGVLELAVAAERAKYTFESLLPSVLGDEPVEPEWLQAFVAAISNGVEAASANLWTLRAAIGDERIPGVVSNPLPLAEITDVEFSGFSIDKELSGSHFLLDGTVFVNSSIANARLDGVSMRSVVFVNCEISNLELIDCEGPIKFEDCTVKALRIINTTSASQPALTFHNCTLLDGDNLIVQNEPAYGQAIYAALVEFKDCLAETDIDKLFSGDWAAKGDLLKGISKIQAQTTSKAEACLRRALRAFFPSHHGSDSALQARRYIRLSALGRGSMPTGAPGQEELQTIFESIGFTTGGRSDHLYGPWSGVAGATQSGLALRAELLEFLRDGKQGQHVQRMLERLEQHFA